jgi:hypothetical protein
MKGKISIPYIPLKYALYSDKVDKLGYIYGDEKRGDGLTYKEYDKRLKDEFNNSNSSLNSYLGGTSVSYLNRKYGVHVYKSMTVDKTKFEYFDIECPVYNMRKSEMQPFELAKCRTEGLMFIMIIDIPIKFVTSEVESELRFWIKDSMSINVHHEIPDAKRLEMLPTKELKIKMGDVEGILSKCRLINFENPFRLTILVEKMLNK